MADLQKFRSHESLNISGASVFEMQTANSQDNSSEEASIYGDLRGYHTILIQTSEDIYYGFSGSTAAILGTAGNNLYLMGGDTIYELAIPQGIEDDTIYFHTLGKSTTASFRWVLS